MNMIMLLRCTGMIRVLGPGASSCRLLVTAQDGVDEVRSKVQKRDSGLGAVFSVLNI